LTSKELAQDLIEFLHQSSTAYQAVEIIKEQLKEAGYRELKGSEQWSLKEGDKVYYIKNDSSIFAADLG
jgi:aspartyl aminopeptidase